MPSSLFKFKLIRTMRTKTSDLDEDFEENMGRERPLKKIICSNMICHMKRKLIWKFTALETRKVTFCLIVLLMNHWWWWQNFQLSVFSFNTKYTLWGEFALIPSRSFMIIYS